MGPAGQGIAGSKHGPLSVLVPRGDLWLSAPLSPHPAEGGSQLGRHLVFGQQDQVLILFGLFYSFVYPFSGFFFGFRVRFFQLVSGLERTKPPIMGKFLTLSSERSIPNSLLM